MNAFPARLSGVLVVLSFAILIGALRQERALALPKGPAGHAFLALGGDLARVFDPAWRWLRGAFASERDLRALRERVGILEAKLVQRERELVYLGRQLRDLAGLRDRLPHQAFPLPARVLWADPSPWARALWVDRGSADGLAEGMSAVAGGILVGRLSEVQERASRVQLLADPTSRCLVEALSGPGEQTPEAQAARPARQGVLRGTGQDRYALYGIANGTLLAAGEAVVTTGFDAKFPRGLYVGRVASCRPGDIFLEVSVEVPTSLAELEGVQILVVGPAALAARGEGEPLR